MRGHGKGGMCRRREWIGMLSLCLLLLFWYSICDQQCALVFCLDECRARMCPSHDDLLYKLILRANCELSCIAVWFPLIVFGVLIQLNPIARPKSQKARPSCTLVVWHHRYGIDPTVANKELEPTGYVRCGAFSTADRLPFVPERGFLSPHCPVGLFDDCFCCALTFVERKRWPMYGMVWGRLIS